MPPLGPGRCSDHDNVVSESAVSGIQLINARQFGYTSPGPGSLPGGDNMVKAQNDNRIECRM